MSISGGGSWGGSEALGGPKGDSGSDRGSPKSRPGQGPNRSDANLSGGSRRDTNAPQGDRGGAGDRSKSQFDTAAMRTARFELGRREKMAQRAYDSSGMNLAVDAFNDDEEGINSISEAIDRFGSWVQDRFGVNNPGGFAKSDAAGALATAGGFVLGGPVGAGVANFAHSTYAARPGQPNMIGNAATALGIGAPGIAGLVGTGVGLIDDYVTDLDNISVDELGGIAGATARASTQTPGLTDFPGGGQGGNDAVVAPETIRQVASRSGGAAVKPKPKPKSGRRTFSPLNLRFASLRGLPTVEELL